MNESLRPDLRGVVLELEHPATLGLLPGETATLVVETVQGTDDPDWVEISGGWSGPDGDDEHALVEVRVAALPVPEVGPVTGNLFLALQPGQWRAGTPPLDSQAVRPDEQAELDVQLIRHTLRPVLDEQDRPTGWVAAEGWWYRPGEPTPDLVRLLVRAEALPAGTPPEARPGGVS